MTAGALRYDTVTFMSDYGLADEFVGVVHSVIRSIAPGVRVIDLTHLVPRYDIRAGALTLARSAPYLCPGVVLAVVDPGVGSERRAIAVEVDNGTSVLVGPDNGLLALAVAWCGGATAAVVLDNPDYQLEAPGPTFAGRDIFAPAAAHLCAGVPLDELGTPLDPARLMPGFLPITRVENGSLVAEVLWVDQYGNAQLNVDPNEVAEFGEVIELSFNGQQRVARRVNSFTEIGPGEVGLLVDSYGSLTIALDRQSAAAELGISTSTEVVLSPIGENNPGHQQQPTVVTTPVRLVRRADDQTRQEEHS
ncbi:MAG: SAM-dependent chlorinase/fluorinase [Acidimicrobiales bacterium]|nr:SAM-dependent chlorinase/fluorinase [Acidimicrobiales bacterium]